MIWSFGRLSVEIGGSCLDLDFLFVLGFVLLVNERSGWLGPGYPKFLIWYSLVMMLMI